MQKLELTWIGKCEKPAVEPRIFLHDPSKDYGDPAAENMLIHGDNLLARKALEQEYAGQVKCIYDNVDYASCADLIYSLIADAKRHFLSHLNNEEAEKVMRDRQRTIAEIIYVQMNEHFYKEEVSYKAANMRPFTRIEPSFGGKFKIDEIYDLRAPMSASEVKSKIFSGFLKAGHTLYKFDSDTERIFAIVLENDKAVLRWLRPAPRQFNIYWGQSGSSRYEPDFVVETDDTIYMCEPKASNQMQNADVLEKQEAAEEYCRAATEFNTGNGGKPWKYLLIAHDEIRPQSSFTYLAKTDI